MMTMQEAHEIQKLRESAERYRTSIEQASDGIFAVDSESGAVCEVNRSGERMTGLSAGVIIGAPVWDLHPAEERPRGRELFEQVVRGGFGRCTGVHFVRPDGSGLRLDITASLIAYGGQKLIQYICRDVAERDDLPGRQAQLTRYYEQLLNSLPVGVGVRSGINSRPRIEFENQTLRRMFETDECRQSGTSWDACVLDPRDPKRITIADDGTYAEERRLASGRTFLYTISYVRNLLDQWCELTIVQDFTRRRYLEDDLERMNRTLEAKVHERSLELERKQAQLVHAEKMASLGSLVAGVAHEINTPLGALTSNTDLFLRQITRLRALLEQQATADDSTLPQQIDDLLVQVEEIGEVSKSAGRRIRDIVHSLRSFARLDRSEKDTVDVRDGLESTLTLVNHELKDRIEVVRRYEEIPQIHCYPNQLNQVFMNLLVNASHAIEDRGTITIRTFAENDRIVISISDTGAGISQEVLPRIFDPGFTTKGFGVGTGLGLSIVHRIIEDHGGTITVDTAPGEGSTFTLTLPIQ